MKRLIHALRNFFFPPEEVGLWRRALPFLVMGLLTVVSLGAANYGWEYTNSSEFCGTTCHTMPPEYSTYLTSPHARVQCVECHIGRGGLLTQFTRKAGDIRHLVLNISGNYEYPIYTNQMRPARDSCERCHFPEKFSDDSLRELDRFANDIHNTLNTTYLLMSTGGGSAREGLGFGIHWHIENPVYFLATDELEQEIPYVRVQNEDGSLSEYVDLSSNIDVTAIQDEDLQEMDCITCHNRITHTTPNPQEAITIAIEKGLISEDLPYVVYQAMALLNRDYGEKQYGLESMSDLRTYYESEYPEIASSKSNEIDQAVLALEDIYNQYIFPDQKVDWNTHPDNLGHQDDPGCFRCHDGGHVNEKDEVIRLECNVCHSVPVVSQVDQLVTTIELSSGVEPPSHTNTAWIALHGDLIDLTCANCHPSNDPSVNWMELEGKPQADDSFCGNTACHSNVWEHAAFDEAAVQPYLASQLEAMLPLLVLFDNTTGIPVEQVPLTYTDLLAPRLEARCETCHSGEDASASLDVSSYAGLVAGGDSGTAIIAGNPEDSSLVFEHSDGRHYATFSPDELARIIEWIEAGAPEN